MRTPRLPAIVLVTAAAAVAVGFWTQSPDTSAPLPGHVSARTATDISQQAVRPGNRSAPDSVRAHSADAGYIIARMQDLKDAVNAQDFSKALEIADLLLAESHDDTVALIRAQVLMSMGRRSRALDALDDILATSDDPEILHQAAVRCLISARDEGVIADVLASQQARLDEAPDDPLRLRTMARMYSDAAEPQNELRIREHLYELEPESRNLARMAELQRDLGLLEEASVSVARLAESCDPDTAAHLLLRQARAENESGRADLAAASARQALALPDLSPFMTMRLARVLQAASDTQEALNVLTGLAVTGETPEVRDRALLETCRITVEQGGRSSALAARLDDLQRSDVPYVREQAARLLARLN